MSLTSLHGFAKCFERDGRQKSCCFGVVALQQGRIVPRHPDPVGTCLSDTICFLCDRFLEDLDVATEPEFVVFTGSPPALVELVRPQSVFPVETVQSCGPIAHPSIGDSQNSEHFPVPWVQ